MNELDKIRYCFYVTAFAAVVLVLTSIAPLFASEPCRNNCECRELHMIRLLLQNQFRVVCDESHCEGSSSSSSNGSSMP